VIKLLKQEKQYEIYQSSTIIFHKKKILKVIDTIRPRLQKMFSNPDTTKIYGLYNFFSLTACDEHCYELFTDLKTVIRNHLQTNKPLWFQCWLNYHKKDEVLDWHDHDWDYHGYISLYNTNDTKTEFKEYAIDNKDGQIYIGPGHREHRVKVPKNFKGSRITLGFDIVTKPTSPANISLIPL